MTDIESEKARLEALIASGYRGGSKQLIKEHGFSQTVTDCYYMVFLRKYRRKLPNHSH